MFKKLRIKFIILNISIITIVMFAAFFVVYITTYNSIQLENKNKLESGRIPGLTPSAALSVSRIPDEPIAFSAGTNSANTAPASGAIVTDDVFFASPAPEYVTISHISVEDSPSFNILVDNSGQILSIYSFFEMSNEAYESAAFLAWTDQKNYSTIKFLEKEWMYKIKPIGRTTTITLNDSTAKLIADGGRFFRGTRTSHGISIYDNWEIFSSEHSAENEPDASATLTFSPIEERYLITFLDVTEKNQTLVSLLFTLVIVSVIMLFVITAISFYFAGRAIKPIAESWEKQKQFIADASHELKTPLAIINSNYGVLASNKEETIESQQKWLDYIKVGTDKMSKLISELLELARFDDPDFKVQNNRFNISNTIRQSMELIEARIAEKEIALISNIESDIFINSDPEKISQITEILLDNAVKYTDNRGEIEVSLKKLKRGIILRIENTGRGIPKENLTKIFDRFFREDSARSGQNAGYGLGLPIADTIAMRLGAKLSAESIENKSTAFTLMIR